MLRSSKVIASYGDEATRDVHYTDNTKAARTVPKDIWPIARRKLNQIARSNPTRQSREPRQQPRETGGQPRRLLQHPASTTSGASLFTFDKGIRRAACASPTITEF